jgi:MFS family permease
MRNTSRLFLVIAMGSVIATVQYFGFALALAALLQKASVPRIIQGAGVAVTVLVPICLAAFWIFRKLQAEYTRREARAAAITFGVFTPLPLAVSLLLGPIVGGYTGISLGTESRMVAFSGAVLGIVVMIALVTFVTSLLAVWVTRRIGGEAHQRQ